MNKVPVVGCSEGSVSQSSGSLSEMCCRLPQLSSCWGALKPGPGCVDTAPLISSKAPWPFPLPASPLPDEALRLKCPFRRPVLPFLSVSRQCLGVDPLAYTQQEFELPIFNFCYFLRHETNSLFLKGYSQLVNIVDWIWTGNCCEHKSTQNYGQKSRNWADFEDFLFLKTFLMSRKIAPILYDSSTSRKVDPTHRNQNGSK